MRRGPVLLVVCLVAGGLAAGWVGAALATGDFDADGVAEVAAGAPGENVGAAVDAGAVEVFTAPGSRLLYQGVAGVGGSAAEPGDAFGSALAAG